MDNDQTLTVQLMHARARITELEAQLISERAKHVVPNTERSAPRAKHELPAHFAAAREAAMRMGRAVAVTA